MDINKEYTGLLEAFNSVYENQEQLDEAKQSFPFKKVAAQQEKARKGSVYGKPATNEPAPNVSDKEKKETGRFSKMHQASEKAKREKQVADKARRSSTFYKDTHPASAPKMKKANEEVETDNWDLVLEYLVAEGHAETNKEALAIMANMSAEDIQGIVEATYGGEKPTDIPADKRMVVTNADKVGNTRAYQELMKKNPNYVAAPHLKGV